MLLVRPFRASASALVLVVCTVLALLSAVGPATSDDAVTAPEETGPPQNPPADALVETESASAQADTLDETEGSPAQADTLDRTDGYPAPADSLEEQPMPSRRGAVAETVGDAADSASVGVGARTAGAVSDSASVAADTVAPAVEAAPRDPNALRVVFVPSYHNQFIRPWSARRSEPRGLGATEMRLPEAAPSGALFKRTLELDLERETLVLLTTVGDRIYWTSIASPLDRYVDIAGQQQLEGAWRNTVLSDLGKGSEASGRGLLDIDIPMPLPGPFVRAIGPGANLKVRGSERITFGGQTSYLVEALPTEGGQPSRFPRLDMEQQLTVNLEGTIGRKIHVYVDHRSGGDAFGAGKADQIRVRYDGDEDEIIQKIELGEVNLSLPGTEFVSYSGHHQGLFGAKLTAKVGKLDLVSVASKEEGKSAGASFTGTSESDSLIIKDISYKAGTFFIIDEDALKYSNVGVQNIKVYLDDRNGANDLETGAQPGFAYLNDPVGASPPADTLSQQGNFVELLETEDYYIPRDNELYEEDSGYELGLIVLTSPVLTGRTLAVSYTRVTNDSDFDDVGGFDGEDLRLKLIKKYDEVGGDPEWASTRRFELKNVYDLGAREIPEEGFEFTIRRGSASGEDSEIDDNGEPYTRILGLDTDDNLRVGNSVIDPTWVDLESGLLVFPHFTPFCPDYDTTAFYYEPGYEPDDIYVADEFDEGEKNCAIYSKENFDADDDDYYFVVKYNRPKTTFYLGQINIIENSEVVRLNGVRLTRGTDYTIYYPAGQLTILAEEAKEPDARVTVEYDYKPFGIGGEKTLLGARGVYNWSEKVRLGTTWMYQSKGTPEDRPRLGEEPSRTVVGDVNLSADFTPEFMTTIADAVPFVDTDAPSKLKVSAEAAVSIPDPNTKGFVAVDDMEGTENISMLGVSRRLWVPSSVPDVDGIVAADRMDIDWYNPDRKVHEGDLHPELPDQEADDTRTVLEIAYDADGSASWAGLMRLLSKTGSDYSDYQFIEMWVNDDNPIEQSTGTVHIDLGTISEDFYPLLAPDGELNTEDTDQNGFDADEDVGLDNVAGVDGQGVAGDDGDDDYNYEYNSNDYTKINGTEGNEKLDTEDLNGNWYIDQDNRYWTLAFDLSDTTYLVRDNSEIVDGNNWRLYRIPLERAEAVNAITSWTSIKSARVWADGFAVGSGEMMIGSMDIVGSQWEPEPIRDADGIAVPPDEMGDMGFRLGSKNTKEDVDYDPPFDPGTDEDTNLPKRESSMFLLYENLRAGHTAAAEKVFFSEDDYTGYRALDFYLHGDAAIEDGTVFFLRLGRDSLNYYEYSLEVRPGWVQNVGTGARTISIPFTDFTDLKLGEYAALDTVSVWGDTLSVRGERFTRNGWPSISRISSLTVGIRNDSPNDSDISGEIWLDDIRLSDVRKDLGWAERATVEAKFADLLNVDFDLRHVDSEFHSLKRERGSGQDNITYNVNSTLNADRFASGLGVSTPVTVSWKRSVSKPKFSTGSDVVLDDEQSSREKTEVLDRSLAVSFSRKRQSPNFWTHLLVDGLSLRASYSDHEKLSPTKIDSSRTIRGRASYRYAPTKSGIRVFRDTQIFLKPTSIRVNADAHFILTSNYDVSVDGVQTKRSANHDKKLNADANVDFQFLENLRTSHGVSVRRDLAQINRDVYGVNVGIETERRYSNSLNFSPKFGKWFAPQYNFTSSFTDNHGPQVRRAGDPFGIRDVRSQSNQEVRASFDIKKLIGPGTPQPRGGQSRQRRGEEGGRARPQDGDAPEDGARETEEDIDEEGDREPREGGDEGAGEGDATEPGTEDEGATEGDDRRTEGGPELGDLVRPVMTFIRNTDAVEARYALKRTSRYDRLRAEHMPNWSYRLGINPGVGADDRTEEHTLSLDSGVKLTSQIRVKGSYKRTTGGRWYRNALSDTVSVITETRSMNENTKGSLSWSGIEKLGGVGKFFSNVRARSGMEYKRSYSGPAGEPSTRGRAFLLNPIVSMDATFKNGLTTSFSWDKKRNRTYSMTGAGSVTEEQTGSMSLSLNYRFSAPQGLKLPFFGQKLKFQSNLDTSLTLRTSSRESRTAPDENGLLQVDPTASTRDLSVTTDVTYSFSRNVSGGLQISFSQSRDEKRDQTRRTIGVHLSAEFKF